MSSKSDLGRGVRGGRRLGRSTAYWKDNRRRRLAFEPLEDRRLLSNLLVTSNADDGSAGTLRVAINQVNSDGFQGLSDSIYFAPSLSGTPIILQEGALFLAGGASVTICNTNLVNPSQPLAITLQGGGSNLFEVASGASLTLDGLTLADGNAHSAPGGPKRGLGATSGANGGAIDNSGAVIVSACNFSSNKASGLGGAIYNAGTLTVQYAATCSGNTAQQGGAIANAAGGTASLAGQTFSGNSATSGAGGALYNLGAMTVAGCTLSTNISQANGGAVYNDGTMTLTGSTLNGNSNQPASGQGNGGAIYNDSGGKMTLSNSTLSGNSNEAGGAIFNGGAVTLSADTISGNSALFGGGVGAMGSLTMVDTIVAGNTLLSGGAYPDINGTVGAASADNLVGDGTGMTGISNGTGGNQVGTSGAPIDPQLWPLGNYGGPTATMPPQVGSPVLNAGGPITTLTAGIGPTDPVIPVASPAAVASTAASCGILIDGEPMTVTAVNLTANTLTVSRSSSAAGHSLGAGVYFEYDQSGGVVQPSSLTIGAKQWQALEPPVVTGLSLATGPVGGGTNVSFTGTNLVGATAVYFGNTPATSFSDNYYGQLTAVSPKGAGTVDVTVTTANGTSAISPADQFTYTPTVLAISPATGPAAGGTGVVITGLGLTGAQAVSFGPKAATGISVNSVTGQVTATSPTGAGTVDVQVTTPDGTSPTSAADQFTYQNSTITSIVVTAPAAATIGVAFNVTITAENSAGQAVSGYTGPVGLFASDGQAVSPAAVPLTNGTATVPVTLYIPDTLTLIGVVGSPSGNLSGSSGSIVVSPVGIKVVVANGTLTAGVPFGVMLTAVDAAGNTCTGDQGYVTLGTGGPTIYGLQNPSVKLVNGTASPTISLHAAGSFTLSALQGTAPGNTGIVVAAATPTALAVAIGPAGSPLSSVNAGTGFTLTVSATDTYGNQACASDILRGTVSVSCSDHQAVTITSFTNYQSQDVPITATVTLDKPDSSVTLKVTSKTKKVNGQTLGLNLKASTAPFAVVLGPPAKFIVSAPASETVGVPFKIKVTAEDAGSNVITSYNQALSFSTTPTQPVTAGATTWSKGVGTTMITLNAAGTPTLTATAGSGASQITGTSGSITVGGDWFSSNVPDPGLQTLARADYVANGGTIRSKSPGDTGGSLTYNNWLGLFTQAETAGTVNSNVLTSLQNLANNAKFLKLSDSVANLAHKVVFSDPANGYYHPLDSNGIAQNQPLGNLQAGDSATKLQDLVNKWFLGMDYPSSEYGNRPSSSTPAYQLVNAPGAANPVPLWGPGESASHVFYFDVQQMYLADCWILAPLAAVAIQDPGAVYSMITYNGNGTYSVRFYNNKVADYVTVDTELPDGGSNCFDNISHVDPGADFSEFVNATGPVAIPTNPTFGQPYNSSELWVALVEKAYAQENGEGWLPSNNPGSDGYGTPGGIGYQAINWSDTEDLWGTDHVIAAYTGKSASGSLTITPSTLGKDFQKGEPAILGTLPEDKTIQTGVHIVERHVYAVIGYYSKSGTFTLFNPWGINGSYYTPDGETSSVFCSGILTPSSSQVQTDFRMEVNGGSVAAGLSHALANVSSTSVAASPSGGSLAAPGAAQRAALGQWSQPATPLAAAHPVVNRLAALDAALASGVAEGQHKLALDGDKLSKDRIDALLGANDLPLAASLNP